MKSVKKNKLSYIYITIQACVLLFLIISSSFAQIRFGPIVGTTVSNLSHETIDTLKSNFTNKTDLAIGGLINIGLSPSLQLVFEPMYIQKSINNRIEYFGLPITSQLMFTYADLPALLKLSLNPNGINPYITGGGTISYLLNAKEEFSNDLGKELFGESVDIKENVNDFDFSWTLGGGLSWPFGPISVFVEGRYSKGSTNIFDSDETEIMHEGYQFLGGITIPFGGEEELAPPEPTFNYNIADDCALHKCVGHRLMIIIGNNRTEGGKPVDRTIHATANWARELKNVNHKVLFFKRGGSDIKLTNPLVPGIEVKKVKITGTRKTRTKTKPGWIPYTYEMTKGKKTKIKKGKSKDYGQKELEDCCFLEEVIVLSHGSKASSHIAKRVIKMLPELTGGRRIRKLTLWLCSTSHYLHPDAVGQFRTYYSELCELMAPRRCPCNCEPGLCQNVCEDPEGKHPNGYKCPGADDPGTIYMAAWHQQKKGGKNKTHASKLYINPDDPTNPLASPNGSIRVVTVSSTKDGGWTATTDVKHGINVFGDIEVDEQEDYEGDHKKSSSVIVDVAAREKQIHGKKSKPSPYTGSLRCPGGEGCIIVPKDM